MNARDDVPSNTTDSTHQANNLYNQVKAMVASSPAIDEVKARLIIEYARDAIDLFGKTHQEEKVDLRSIVDEQEKVLSPESIDSLRKRSERAILRVIYPRNRRLRNSFLLMVGFVTIASIFLSLTLGIWGSKDKQRTIQSPGIIDQPTAPSEEITIALPEAATLLGSSESDTVGKWLYTLVLAGSGSEALQYARRIPDPIRRSEALAFIAQAFSKVSESNEASAIATLAVEAEDEVYKGGLGRLQRPALFPITKALVDVGRVSDAIEFAHRYKAHPDVPWSLYLVAKHLRCIGMRDEAKRIATEALEAINTLKDPLMQPLALIEDIRLFASLGETEKALKLSRAIRDPAQQNEALLATAKEAFQLGDVLKAKQIVDEALNKGRESGKTEIGVQALASVSRTLHKTGGEGMALAIAFEAKNSIPSPSDSITRFTVLMILFKTFTRLGRTTEANELITEAVSIARLIDRADLRTSHLIFAAKALFRVGRSNEANEFLNEALSSAKQIPYDVLRSSEMLEIVRAWAKFGSFQRALEIINLCSSSDHKLAAYVAIARESSVQRNLIPSKFFDKDEDEKDWPYEVEFGCSPQTH